MIKYLHFFMILGLLETYLFLNLFIIWVIEFIILILDFLQKLKTTIRSPLSWALIFSDCRKYRPKCSLLWL